jgi:hypothetical protein
MSAKMTCLIAVLLLFVTSFSTALLAQTPVPSPTPSATPTPQVTPTPPTQTNRFSPTEKTALVQTILGEAKEARQHANANWNLYVGFKVVLFLIAIGTIVFSVLGNKEKDETRKNNYGTLTTLLASLTTALSAFAFTELDFQGKYQAHQQKSNALFALVRELDYLDPDKAAFITKYNTALATDGNVPEVKNLKTEPKKP